MAGSRTASIHRGNTEAASGISQWLIKFARFVQYPASTSLYPGLKPVGKRDLDYASHGTWLSTSSSKVSLQMFDEVNRSDVILSVELFGRVLEEHYISKLNFTWPQMSCVSGFPSRGCRAIFVSYMDSASELQKFALRFSTCDEALNFVVALKEKLKGLEEAGNQRNETRATEEEPSLVEPLYSYHVPKVLLPRLEYEAQNQIIETRSEGSFQSDYNPSNEIVPRYQGSFQSDYNPSNEIVPKYQGSFQSDYNPSNEIVSRAVEEVPNMVEPLDSYIPEMIPRLEYKTGQTLYLPQSSLSQITNESSINLPPSFTTLLSSCFPNSTLDAGQTSVKQDPDLKSQILKYMEDSSFQDMLQKVERIIDEIGGNWIP